MQPISLLNVLGHGTTGLVSWQGAVLLSNWADTFQDLLKGKDVLELGSGLGLFGMTLAKKSVARSVTFTACHHKVLNFLSLNAKLNFTKVRESKVQ